MQTRGGGFISELGRRNVARMAGLYLVSAWLVVQVADTLLPMFDAPDWIARALVIVLAIGFLPALGFAWVFELTPDGLKRDAEVPLAHSIGRDTARRMERMILVVLALALGFFAVDRFVFADKREDLRVEAAKAELHAKQQAEAARATEQSIAVLPFANMGDPSNEYLSDGLSEEIINVLAKLDGLRVIARSSSFQFKGKSADSREMGRTLGVAYLLEGSVQRASERLRISVRLVKATDGSTAWTQRFDRGMEDIFAVQSEIATTVGQQLKLAIKGTSKALVGGGEPPNGNIEAYEALLQARYYVNSIEYDKAIEHLTRAISLEPGYALAHALIASVQAYLSANRIEHDDVLKGKARASLAEAKRLAPNAAFVHRAEAYLLETLDADLQGALRAYRRAATLEPNDLATVSSMADMSASFGDLQGAIRGYRSLLAVDPLSTRSWLLLARYYMSNEQWPEAQSAFGKLLELGHDEAEIQTDLALLKAHMGLAGEALAHVDAIDDELMRAYIGALVHEKIGNRMESQVLLEQLQEKSADDAAAQISQIYAMRNEPEQMFKWLERAKDRKSPWLVQLLLLPEYRPFKRDPRFQALLRELRLIPEDVAQDNAVAIQGP